MRILTRIFAVIGFIAFLGVLAAGGIYMRVMHSGPTMPGKAILAMTIEGELQEKPGFDPLKLDHQMSLNEALTALHAAATDKRITGVFINITDNLPLTQAQELHDAVTAFRRSGKPVYAFADTFGEQDAGAAEFYLATAASKVWLQPMGTVGLMGISADEVFLKNAMAKYGVEFEVTKREQYKTAFDNLSESGFTPANREMTKSLLDDIVDQVLTGIAADRKIDVASLRKLMDTGPLSADDAKDAKLIDEVDYRDQALDDLEDVTSTDDTVSVHHYLNVLPAIETKSKIALIYAQGELMRHPDGGGLDPLSGDQASDPRDVLAAFKQASDDDDVKAIVFRINSPGGSVVASETIRSGLLIAKDAGKPIIVSMGEMAGSGGYWIAADADKIIAEPATLTGSIGVLGGKPVVEKLMADHDVVGESITVGQNADMDSIFHPFTPGQLAKQNQMLDDIYSHFKGLVADGRKLSDDKVEQIAKGRVYTARQAKDLGLVDELGGLETAIMRAKEAIGLQAADQIEIDEVPHEPTLAEVLHSLLEGADDDDDDDSADALMHSRYAAGANLKMLAALRPYLHLLMENPADHTVLMAPLTTKQ
jgi:protease-4